MSETIIEVDTPPAEEPESSAEEIAEAIVEAQEEAREEAETEEAVETAVEASESALEAVSTHDHSEYSLIGHTHPEYEHSERMSLIESRLETIERSLEAEAEETEEVEEIEPTHEPAPEPEKRRAGFRRGRR